MVNFLLFFNYSVPVVINYTMTSMHFKRLRPTVNQTAAPMPQHPLVVTQGITHRAG